nr:WYL domain-containing protein [Propionibacterium sp.]
MSARKSERIMNLTICLLMARRFVEREQIRQLVEGYHGLSDAAFERTFERDKEELRTLGVPIETGSNSALFPDEVGYRIRRTDFELPPLEFDAAETAALGLASTVWEQARLADATVRAVAKLRAAGVEPDASRAAALEASVGAAEPAFEPLWQALLARTRVRFTYHGVVRVVEPWTLAYRRGAWYLVAFDTTRGERRLFKVTRISDAPAPVGRPGAYEIPALDLAESLAALEPAPATAEALLAIADAAAPDLRRRATPAAAAAAHTPAGGAPPGYGLYRWPYAEDRDAAGELAAHGADVVVLAPPALRDAVIAHLRAVAEGAAGAAPERPEGQR